VKWTFWRKALTVLPRVASNLWSYCIRLRSARIKSVHQHAWQNEASGMAKTFNILLHVNFLDWTWGVQWEGTCLTLARSCLGSISSKQASKKKGLGVWFKWLSKRRGEQREAGQGVFQYSGRWIPCVLVFKTHFKKILKTSQINLLLQIWVYFNTMWDTHFVLPKKVFF
jgi:hypothetical protein